VKHARSLLLHNFIAATQPAFDHFVRNPDGRRAAAKVFHALEVASPTAVAAGIRLPVSSLLSAALSIEVSHPCLRLLLDAFGAVEPQLRWRRRESYDHTASENFPSGHANAMIVGPGGLEERNDVWVGVSLLAPSVRYPDHSHPPEEVYLVASDGEFRQGRGTWFTPGVGGTLYNSPGIQHAMRSSNTPLLAFWLLPIL
jgi:quercetin dioxygenase-like cupin family protein